MNRPSTLARFKAGTSLSRSAIPELFLADLTDDLVGEVERGLRVVAYFGSPEGAGIRLYLVLADDARSELAVGTARLPGESFPSVAEACPQVQLFEREIAEQWGPRPVGHPWLKPVRYAPPLGGRARPLATIRSQALGPPGVTDFFRVEGAEVHEVGVGPVHAGVIEPGHFRF